MTGPGAQVFATAQTMARAGHDVYLVSDAIAAARSRSLLSAGSPTWVRVEETRPDHRYFTESLGYADRVYDALRRLHQAHPLDAAEFADAGAEALTVLRAKRLLGEFPATRVAVRLGSPAASPGGHQPVRLPELVTAFAEQYCREHADLLVATSPPAARAGGEPDGLAAGGPVSGGSVQPLVSVLIPLFNQGRYLAEALASVRRCGYPRLEVVVVDDGSTDPATVAAFDALTGETKIRQRNAGLAAARNAGLARCRGRYVVPLDADDLLPPGFVGAAVGALRRDPRLHGVAGYLRYFEQLDAVQVPLGHVPGLSLVVNTHARATGLYRRDTLVGLGGWDPRLPAYEDWDLHIRLHAAGCRTDVLPIEGHWYRRHQESMTFTAGPERRLELLQRLLGKHAAALPGDQLLELLQVVTHLWKTGYEPSASALLLDGRPGDRPGSRPGERSGGRAGELAALGRAGQA